MPVILPNGSAEDLMTEAHSSCHAHRGWREGLRQQSQHDLTVSE